MPATKRYFAGEAKDDEFHWTLGTRRAAPAIRDDASGNVAIVFALMGVVLMLAHRCRRRCRPLAATRATRPLRRSTLRCSPAAASLQTNSKDKAAAVAAAQKYYDENVTSRLPVVDDTVNFTVNSDGMGMKASGTAYIKTPFLQLRQHRKAATDQHLADRLRQIADRRRRQRRREHRGLADARYHRLDVQLAPGRRKPCTSGRRSTP